MPNLLPSPSLTEIKRFAAPMIPKRFVRWERTLIKQWDLSYVERLMCGSPGERPSTFILKITAPPWAREKDLYHWLGAAPPLMTPKLLLSEQRYGLLWMLLEDVSGDGPTDICTEDLWCEAMAGLARLHRKATEDLSAVPESLPRYTLDNFVALVERVLVQLPALGVPEADEVRPKLLRAAHSIVAALDGEPVTLIHGDCYAENFVLGPRGLTLVDWSFGALGPGLLDLAAILFPDRKNEALAVSPDLLLESYCGEASGTTGRVSSGKLLAAHLMNQFLHLIWMHTRLSEGYTSVGPVDRWTANALYKVLDSWAEMRKLIT